MAVVCCTELKPSDLVSVTKDILDVDRADLGAKAGPSTGQRHNLRIPSCTIPCLAAGYVMPLQCRSLALHCCSLTPRAALLSLWVLRSLYLHLCAGLGVLDQAVQQLLAVAEAAPEVKHTRTLSKQLPLLLRAVVGRVALHPCPTLG